MPDSIRDGKGRGNLAAVTDEQRMLVTAGTIEMQSRISREHGQSYSFDTGIQTLSAIDTWHWVLWWNVTATASDFVVSGFEIAWNGGSTNFNRPLEVKNVEPTAGAPTANQTAVTHSQNNKNSNNAALMTVYKWDGVGAGMTTSTGPSGGNLFFSQGYTKRSFNDSVIAGLNEAVGFMVQSPEVGDFSIGVSGYFLHKEAEI